MSAYTTEVFFEKWQGCLNDFLLVSATSQTLIPTMKLLVGHASELCARDGSGIGADGIILVCAGEKYMVWVINRDGSFARNCGNGLRCAAMAFFRNNAENVLEIALGGRMVSCQLYSPSPERMLVTVDMGEAKVNTALDWYDDCKAIVHEASEELELPQMRENFACVEIGNRHLVFFSLREKHLVKIGSYLQRFDGGINVHVAWANKGSQGMVYNARTYERGVGITTACGTGACAVAAAVFAEREAELQEAVDEKWLKIKMRGGLLLVKKTKVSDHLVLAGSAQYVFRGFVDL